MDWTPKTHFQWDWESLALFNGEDTEIAKPAEEPKSKIESGIDFCTGLAYSTGMVVFSSTEQANCSFKSSISTHFDSSSKAMTIAPEISDKSVEGYPNDQYKFNNLAMNDNSESSSNVLSAKGVKEPIIGLKLGRRTYFEDPCVGNNPKGSSSSSSTNPSNTFVKKSRVYQQSTLSTYCQVEGCHVDLSTAKDYHRKHRVCETHSKSPRVVVAGQERRFCQQCSRFHSLSEFDQKKRSCRRRLYDHNARRRKPQLETFSFNSTKLPPSFYDDKQYANLEFGQVPFSPITTRAGLIWDGSGTFKLNQTDSSEMKPNKIEGIEEQLHFPSNGDPDSVPTVCYGMGNLLPLKSTAAEVHNQGLEASVAFNLDGTQDLRRVLSLLSTDSHTQQNLQPPSSVQFLYAANNADAAHHPAAHSFHAATMGLWQAEQSLAQVLPCNTRSGGGPLQESPPLRPSSHGTTGFYDAGRLS